MLNWRIGILVLDMQMVRKFGNCFEILKQCWPYLLDTIWIYEIN